jgi:hypothetical protein
MNCFKNNNLNTELQRKGVSQSENLNIMSQCYSATPYLCIENLFISNKFIKIEITFLISCFNFFF